MNSAEHMILSDAIQTAVKAEKKVIKQRRLILALAVTLACVVIARRA